jgi:hypothetical protein
MLYMINEFVLPESPPHPNILVDGNDEAAMVSLLLEADAGLGGPVVDFSVLPWSLP